MGEHVGALSCVTDIRPVGFRIGPRALSKNGHALSVLQKADAHFMSHQNYKWNVPRTPWSTDLEPNSPKWAMPKVALFATRTSKPISATPELLAMGTPLISKSPLPANAAVDTCATSPKLCRQPIDRRTTASAPSTLKALDARRPEVAKVVFISSPCTVKPLSGLLNFVAKHLTLSSAANPVARHQSDLRRPSRVRSILAAPGAVTLWVK